MRSIFAFILVTIFAMQSYAIQTQYFTEQSIVDFEKGEFHSISIDQFGRLQLSPSVETIQKQSVMFVWCMAKDSKGNIYVGTGNQGKVFRILPNQTIELFYETKSISVSSIVIDSNDTVYIATTAPVQVLKISTDRKAEVMLPSLDSDYIWDMAIDEQDRLFLACGNPAVIYELDANHETKALFQSPDESHFLTIEYHQQTLYFGSEGKGIVYQWDLNSKDSNPITILYDSYEDELVDIILDPQNNLLLATGSRMKKVPSGEFDYIDSFLEYGSKKGVDQSANKKQGKGFLKNSVYRINPETRQVEKLLTVDNSVFTCLEMDQNENIYVGSGDEGILYKIDPQGVPYRYVTLKDKQVLSLKWIDAEHIIIGTGNSGSILRLGLSLSQEGEYISQVYDTQKPAVWGRIQWELGNPEYGSIVLHTRSGNSQKPDSNWSAWTDEYTQNIGSPITSPSDRFIQYKAIIKSNEAGKSPTLHRVVIPFQINNLPPQVSTIACEIPNPSKTQKTSSDSLKITWKGSDPNNDSLVYHLYIRDLHSDYWIPLDHQLTKTEYQLEANRFADGTYIFKVTASDSPSNSVEGALESDAVSAPCVVDQSSPVFQNLSLRFENDTYLVTGEVVDKVSNIERVEFSVNGSAWVFIPPINQLYDNPKASFEFRFSAQQLENLIPGKNILTLRASDDFSNIAIERVLVLNEMEKMK